MFGNDSDFEFMATLDAMDKELVGKTMRKPSVNPSDVVLALQDVLGGEANYAAYSEQVLNVDCLLVIV